MTLKNDLVNLSQNKLVAQLVGQRNGWFAQPVTSPQLFDQDKKEAFTYLDLKVKASPEGVDIKGYVDLNLITIGQTWASRHERSYRFRLVLTLRGTKDQ